jgi:hypothetical protein
MLQKMSSGNDLYGFVNLRKYSDLQSHFLHMKKRFLSVAASQAASLRGSRRRPLQMVQRLAQIKAEFAVP